MLEVKTNEVRRRVYLNTFDVYRYGLCYTTSFYDQIRAAGIFVDQLVIFFLSCHPHETLFVVFAS